MQLLLRLSPSACPHNVDGKVWRLLGAGLSSSLVNLEDPQWWRLLQAMPDDYGEVEPSPEQLGVAAAATDVFCSVCWRNEVELAHLHDTDTITYANPETLRRWTRGSCSNH